MANNYSDRFVTLVDDAKTRVEEVNPDELKEKLDSEDNFVLLDVREQDEWDDSRIAGANYLGKGIIERDIENEHPNIDEEIILYCGRGFRSALAADNLQKMGYNNVKILAGGFGSWTEAGYPIEKGAQ